VLIVPVPRLHHYDNLGTARFVTFSCFMRLPSLAMANARTILAEEVDRGRVAHGFALLGYVFMPEHVHLVLLPPDGMRLGRVIGEIKSRSARRYFDSSAVGGPDAIRVFWQPRCYDHNCRTPDDVREKIHYCHNNPVKRGLATDPADWTWSSYNAYEGKRDVPLAVDAIPL
jgi:putative transposase